MSDDSGGQSYLAREREHDQSYHHRHRKDQILADDAAGPATELNGVSDLVEVVSHDHHVGGLECDVCASRTERDPDIGHRERWSVVYAVSYHGDRAMPLPESLEDLCLSIWQKLCVDLIDIEIRSDGLRGAPVVAREHREVPNTLPTQMRKRLLESAPRGVGDLQLSFDMSVQAHVYGRGVRGPVSGDRFQES